MGSDAPEKTGKHLDEQARRTLGILLRKAYEDHVNSELPAKLTEILDRFRKGSE
jgi:hypothetical protein